MLFLKLAYKRFAIFFFILNFFNSISSQDILIQDWLGEWETLYNVNDDLIKENLLIKEIHNHTFIKIEENGGILVDSILEFRFSADMYLTFDFMNHKTTGFRIDNHGFNGMMQITAEIISDNKLNINGENSYYLINETWEVKNDGKLYRKKQDKVKETKEDIISEAVFTKVK